jgi:glycerol-1-phosphate dehydrogenase [NAD(P)+]
LPLEKIDVSACCERWPTLEIAEANVRELLRGTDFVHVGVNETAVKYSDVTALRIQLERLKTRWPALRLQLREQLLPFSDLKERLRQVGAPIEPEQIGISRTRLRDSFRRALAIRRRFTVLDLVDRAQLLDTCLDQLFGAKGPWPTR